MSVPALPMEERFWRYVDRSGGVGACWPWQAYIAGNGYGRFMVGETRQRIPRQAHRVAFELVRGPIPAGLHLDHLCRNRACVNPAHLEPVTQAENNRRAESGHAKKTHCPAGHPYDEANTYIMPAGGRDCKECVRERGRRYRARLASHAVVVTAVLALAACEVVR